MPVVNGVEFHFHMIAKRLKEAHYSETGSVRRDEHVMVLEVACPGDRPYVIVGKQQPWGGYEGVHEGLPGDVEVSAQWARLKDEWVGTWLEEGYDYVFRFSVPEEDAYD